MSANEFDPRHNARIIVLQRLFEKDFKDSNTNIAVSDSFSDLALQEISELGEYDRAHVETLYNGVVKNCDHIDTIISKLAPEWPIKNIARIDLMILRLAIYEGFILKSAPQKVVIDEAIELSKEFSNDQTRKFISGVLGNLFTNETELLK